MSLPRLISPLDRNISTSLPPGLEIEDLTGGLDPASIDPAQLDAARALLAREPLGIERAIRVALCPPLHGQRDPIWRRACRIARACPRCAERRARGLAHRMIEQAIEYSEPRAVLVSCPSRTLLDLPDALRRMRSGIATLRRRRWFSAAVNAGVLAIETPLTRDGRRWALHAHGVVDVAPSSDVGGWRSQLASEWRELVGIPGAVFELEPLRSSAALAGYALKIGDTKSWSPGGRDLPPARRAHLDAALRGRRLIIAWGAACRA
jgi:hypothetical protein